MVDGWLAYIKNMIETAPSVIKKAAIVGLNDGTVWAKSEPPIGEAFHVSAEELQKISNFFLTDDGYQKAPVTGIVFEGVKYVVPLAQETLIFGKKAEGGIFVAKTNTALLIALFAGDRTEGQACRQAIERVANYLQGQEMKILSIDATTSEHLGFFNDKDETVCQEFCQVATTFLKQGINLKLYSSAAAKMGVEVDVVKHAVEAVMRILIEGAKIEAKDSDLRDSLSNTSSASILINAIVDCYVSIFPELHASLTNRTISDIVPEYKDLNWRLEVEIASRAARQIYRPVITFNLATTLSPDTPSSNGIGCLKIEEHLLQTDAATLVQITQELENALKEAKTREYRKLTNQISK